MGYKLRQKKLHQGDIAQNRDKYRNRAICDMVINDDFHDKV